MKSVSQVSQTQWRVVERPIIWKSYFLAWPHLLPGGAAWGEKSSPRGTSVFSRANWQVTVNMYRVLLLEQALLSVRVLSEPPTSLPG